MKTPEVNIAGTRFARVISTALALLATLLAISGLNAESQGRSWKRRECVNWPPDALKAKVAYAFDTALKDSALKTGHGPALRDGLLNSPITTMNALLRKLYPNDNIVFPKHTLLKFYEPENPQTSSSHPYTYRQWYPKEHCIHVFYLPEVGQQTKDTDFQHNLMCCYPPWAPDSKRVNKP